MLFEASAQELILFRHEGKKFATVHPNANGRCEITELHLEVAILEDWVRFWFRGRLLPLPADLQRELVAEKQRAEAERFRADAERGRADAESHRANLEIIRAGELQRELENQTRQLAEVERANRAADEELVRLRGQLEGLRGGQSPGPPMRHLLQSSVDGGSRETVGHNSCSVLEAIPANEAASSFGAS